MRETSAETSPGRIPALFLGDLADPWVAGIAGALPDGSRTESCPGPLPTDWPDSCPPADVLVLHRDTLSASDRERLAVLKGAQGPAPRVVLCHGPHARPHQLETWLALVDAFLPEATASEVVARHVRAEPRRDQAGSAVSVVSGQFDWRAVLADALKGAGYAVDEHRDWPSNPSDLVVWDVPALDPRWPDLLERRTLGRRVVALLEFADRPLVRAARSAGAAACLDSLCEIDDLIAVIDRLAASPPLPHGWRVRADGPSGPTVRPPQRPAAPTRRRASRPIDRAD